MAKPWELSLEEVQKHSKKDDLWLIIDNKVYDVSKYRLEHPGGEEVMEEAAGRDATKDFNDVGHSSEAREIMKRYYIGELAECDRKKVRQAECLLNIGALLLGFVAVFFIRRAFFSK